MGVQRQRQRGFTLVELMVGLAVAAILAFMAAPGFTAMFSRLRLQGVASELAADLQYARSEAVRRRAAVALGVDDDKAGYSISSGGTTFKAVRFGGGLTMTAADDVTYSALRAMANPVSVLISASGESLQVSTNAIGRVSICAPEGRIKGYPTC